MGKGENAGFRHFLLFPQCFQKASSSGLLKVGMVWERYRKRYFLLTGTAVRNGWSIQYNEQKENVKKSSSIMIIDKRAEIFTHT